VGVDVVNKIECRERRRYARGRMRENEERRGEGTGRWLNGGVSKRNITVGSRAELYTEAKHNNSNVDRPRVIA
jgi:hypothetical protein